jgi:hypothetical protein
MLPCGQGQKGKHGISIVMYICTIIHPDIMHGETSKSGWCLPLAGPNSLGTEVTAQDEDALPLLGGKVASYDSFRSCEMCSAAWALHRNEHVRCMVYRDTQN